MLVVQCKTAVFPLLTHWRYCSLVLNHRCLLWNTVQLYRDNDLLTRRLSVQFLIQMLPKKIDFLIFKRNNDYFKPQFCTCYDSSAVVTCANMCWVIRMTTKAKTIFTNFKYKLMYRSCMTSSSEDIFRVTGHLCGKFTDRRWISLTKASDVELWCAWINGWVNNREAGDMRCHRAHYDVTVMWSESQSTCSKLTSNDF